MIKLFTPSINLMNRLSYSKKVIFIGFAAILSISFLSIEQYIQINKVIKESKIQLVGIEHLIKVNKLTQLAQQYRGLSSAVNSGKNLKLQEEYLRKVNETEKAFFAVINNLDPKMSLKTGFYNLGDLSDLGNLEELWNRLKTNHGNQTEEQDFIEHTFLIKQLNILTKLIGDHYKLFADGDLSSYYLVDNIINVIPNATEDMGQIRALLITILANKKLTSDQKIGLVKLESHVNFAFDSLNYNIAKASNYSPHISAKLKDLYTALLEAKTSNINYIHTDILNNNFSKKPDVFYFEMTEKINYIYELLYKTFIPDLRSHFERRIKEASNKRLYTTSGALILWLLVFYFLMGLYLSVRNNFKYINSVLTDYTNGNFQRRINLDTQDDMQVICDSFNNMANVIDETLNYYQEEKDRFEKLFEKSGFGQIIIDDAVFIKCNEAAVKMMGYDTKLSLMKRPEDLSPEYQPDGCLSSEKAREYITSCLEIGNAHFEWIHRKKDGTNFWVDVMLTRFDYKGRTVIHASWRDISVSKQLAHENELIQKQAIIANNAKSTFLANMSHELRTPMHGILSFARFGINKIDVVDKEKLKRYFSNIEVSGNRLMVLLNDLLDLSKLESGKMDFHKNKNDLYEVYKSCCLEQEQRLLNMELTVNVDKPDYPLTGYFDAPRVGQVITNILSNAIKFSHESSVLIVTFSKTEKNELLFSIQDKGIGIDESELETIFDAFIQSSKTDTGTGGTGLGLAICKEIIEGHDGKIWANNIADGGSIFTFTIPAGDS